uniref:protein mono-ADP-ribosyltransferase PARP14-like n=1 Tax=Styela clava TaxID=7725 RepID=UPI001939BD15|nr:protein mono-ADP-ribosyltransferase PARP14-like [Styela clava]
MNGNSVTIHGLPITCNVVKIKLKFESDCKVKIKNIKLGQEQAKVFLENAEDCQTFCASFPRTIKFGTTEYSLTVSSDKKDESNKVSPHTHNAQNPTSEISKSKWDFSLIHSWSTMEELSNKQKGLLVQPRNVDIKPQDIIAYFESFNDQLSGGLISRMYPMIDGIFIIFEDSETVEQIWNWRPHRINGKRVDIFVKLIPKIYGNRVVVTPCSDDLREDDLQLLLHQCSSKTLTLKKVELQLTKSFLVLYDAAVDKKDIRQVVEKFRKKNSDHKISFLRKTDCICVTKAPYDVCDDELITLFGNSDRAGGGQVTRIDRLKDENGILIYFSSYQDAEKIVDKFRGKTLPFCGFPLKLSLYFHCLYDRHVDIKNIKEIDEYYAKNIFTRTEPVIGDSSLNNARKKTLYYYKDADVNILKFLFEKQEHMNLLNSSLQPGCSAEATWHGLEISLSTESTDAESKCKRQIDKFLKDYISQKFSDFDETNKEIIDLVDSDNDDVCIRWANEAKDEVVVTGLKAEVDSFISSLETPSDYKTLHLKEGKIRWLVDCGILKQIMKEYQVVINHDENFKSINFSGMKENSLKAQSAIKKTVSTLKFERYIPSEKAFLEFLKDSKQNEKISQHVLRIFQKENVCANLQFEDDWPYIWSDEKNMSSSLACLNDSLVVDESMELFSVTMNEKQSQGWKIASAMETDGKIQLRMKENILSIVGFKQFVSQAKEKLKELFGSLVNFRMIYKAEYGKAQFFLKFENFRDICRKNQLKHELVDEGILLKGTQRGLKTMGDALLAWNKNTVLLSRTVEKHGIVEYFIDGKSKHVLDTIGKNNKSTIFVKTERQRSQMPKKPNDDKFEWKAPSHKLNKVHSVALGPLKISVRQGDITNETNDGIVNVTGITFDLSKGTISRKIVEKGGKIIKQEVFDSTGKYIRVTSNGKLKCKKILHAVIPNDRKKIVKFLVDVLKEANFRKCLSLSIPAIGTGIIGLSSAESAKMMFDAFREFVKEVKNIEHLKIIDIVIFEDSHLSDFETEVAMQGVGNQIPTKKSTYGANSPKKKSNGKKSQSNNTSATIGNLTVSVRQGDITLETNTAIVNSTGTRFDLSQGMVSQAIIRKGGFQIQKEVKSAKGDNIRVTSGGKLSCAKIIHVVTPKNPDKIGVCLINILYTAEQQSCSSISIPAIGTGQLKLPSVTIAKILMKAIHEFVDRCPNTKYLTKVDFVIYEESQMSDFRQGLLESETEYEKTRTYGSQIGKQLHGQRNAYDEKKYSPDDINNDKGCKKVEFQIYSFTQEYGEKAWTALMKKIEEMFPTYTITDNIVIGLIASKWEAIEQLRQKHNVLIQRSKDKISIEGKSHNVSIASDEIKVMLKEFGLNHTGWNAYNFSWAFKSKFNTWENFEDDISQKLELLFLQGKEKQGESSRTEENSDFVKINDQVYHVDFQNMRFFDGTDIKRIENKNVGTRRTEQLPMNNNHFGSSSTDKNRKGRDSDGTFYA